MVPATTDASNNYVAEVTFLAFSSEAIATPELAAGKKQLEYDLYLFLLRLSFLRNCDDISAGGRDHIETTLQAEAGEDEAVIMVLGFQATDEEPLAAPPQHLINSTTGPQNHQTLTIHDQEFIRPHSQTSSMDTFADDSYWIVREAWPLRSLNLSNGAEEQHYTSLAIIQENNQVKMRGPMVNKETIEIKAIKFQFEFQFHQNGMGRHKDLIDVLLDIQKTASLEIPLTMENIKAIIIEFIRPHSQTTTMDTLADDSYWIVREAWPLRSLNLSNGAEEQHYASKREREHASSFVRAREPVARYCIGDRRLNKKLLSVFLFGVFYLFATAMLTRQQGRDDDVETTLQAEAGENEIEIVELGLQATDYGEPSTADRNHVETTLQAEGGEDIVVEVVDGFQAPNEEP
ncbi:hypothetical protein Sjap_024488 [Stephania japonica]|uniref:Uncharacterized protein n=1 Tax=Stephania japonica TaxID=461633 RepID=A0AAP0EDG0_9MAGN